MTKKFENEVEIEKRRGSNYEKDGCFFCKEWTYVKYGGKRYVATEEDAQSILDYHSGKENNLSEWAINILESMTETIIEPKKYTEEEKDKIRTIYNMAPYKCKEVEVERIELSS
ncbi:MAG: hypothetical protein N4A47_04405 [Clostridia bacterium]|jgi:hypothetical protein|nr:hypothetical protein [Clostridia bacterium]